MRRGCGLALEREVEESAAQSGVGGCAARGRGCHVDVGARPEGQMGGGGGSNCWIGCAGGQSRKAGLEYVEQGAAKLAADSQDREASRVDACRCGDGFRKRSGWEWRSNG